MGHASSSEHTAQPDALNLEDIALSLELNKLDLFKGLVSSIISADESHGNQASSKILRLAAMHDNVQALEWLFSAMNCDASDLSENGRSLLHLAAREGCLNSVMYLVEKAEFNVEVEDHDGYTPYLIAVAAGELPCVKYLASKIPAKSVSLQSLKDGRTCVHICAQHGHVVVLRWLIDTYPSIQADRIEKAEGMTAFHLAARFGHATMLDFILRHCNVDPNVADSNGRTALHHASMHDQIDAVRYLVEQICMDPFAEDQFGLSSIEHARRCCCSKVVGFYSDIERTDDFI